MACSSTFSERKSLRRRALSIMRLSAPASVGEQDCGREPSLEVSGLQLGSIRQCFSSSAITPEDKAEAVETKDDT